MVKTEEMPLLRSLVKNYLAVRRRRSERKIEDEQDKAEMSQIERELRPLLEDQEAQSVRFDDLGVVYLETSHYAAVIKGQEEALCTWLDAHGQGALAKRTVNPATLRAQFQEWMAANQPLPPEEIVKRYSQIEVRVRTAGPKKGGDQ